MDKIDRRTAISVTAFAALTSATGWREAAATVRPPMPARAAATGFVVEYFYKVKWGHFDEFLDLYIKNHYPILKRYRQMGRIVGMSAAFPINHAGEASRWDMRYSIVWKDAATAFEDFAGAAAITKELYPDQATFKKEEQRRFELLMEHMDVPVAIDDLSSW
ncbi:MAG: hypothetical protein ACKVZ0_10190 [Gemmatimonadales bacterium]